MPSSYRAQLEEAFAKGKMVKVCWEPQCRMHQLEHWEDDQWVECERHRGYANYSHGICPRHARQYHSTLHRFLAARVGELIVF